MTIQEIVNTIQEADATVNEVKGIKEKDTKAFLAKAGYCIGWKLSRLGLYCQLTGNVIEIYDHEKFKVIH